MATVDQLTDTTTGETTPTDSRHDSQGRPVTARPAAARWRRLLQPLASLKLTVALFAMSIVIVLAGTMAQVNQDIWAVINSYFRINFSSLFSTRFPWLHLGELFVWIDSQLFAPASFFPSKPNLPNWLGFWFPKGWLIGAVMLMNLVAAHAVRFRVQTRGARLWLGVAIIALGCLVTALVIASGSNTDGLQSQTWVTYDTLWRVMQVSLLALAAAAGYGAFGSEATRGTTRWLLGTAALALTLADVSMFAIGPLGDSSMRILYQLLKGTLAGGVLLVGCVLVFNKRAGIVLLHGGIGLMMVYEVLVGTAHVESRMTIEEGQAVNYSEDIRTAELAIVDRTDADSDTHTVIPASLLADGETIENALLPFDVQVVAFYPNSDLRRISTEELAGGDFTNLATTGHGERLVAEPVRPTVGTDSEGRVDTPAAYVTLRERETGKDLGSYLLSTLLMPPFFATTPDTIRVDGRDYELSLRFKRLYKPYQIELQDVQKNDYIGTNTVRDYRSIIRLRDAERGTDFEQRIWMNNPLRYAGETFYQSSYHPPGSLGSGSKEATGLQVVSNTGWMTPYVSCMIVAVGMLAQFTLVLLRFLDRRRGLRQDLRDIESPDRPARSKPQDQQGAAPARTNPGSRRWVLPLLTVLLTTGLFAALASPRSTNPEQMQLDDFGRLPVLYQGRAQPIDSLARNSLLMISDKQTFKNFQSEGRSRGAIEWLLDVVARDEAALDHQVFRIESLEVVDMLGLEHRPGHWRYSISEFQDKLQDLDTAIRAAEETAADDRTMLQRKILDLARRLSTFQKLQVSFQDFGHAAPQFPTPEEMQADPQAANQKIQDIGLFLSGASQRLREMKLPLPVPSQLGRDESSISEAMGTDWLEYPLASVYAAVDAQMGRGAAPAFEKLKAILSAYADEDPAGFNSALSDYQKLLQGNDVDELTPPGSGQQVSLERVNFESFFNRFAPFNLASWVYVLAFVLVAVSWLVWTEPLNRIAFWIIVTTAVLHTLAVAGRIYISGRPPVTNLYSSAVFIGWAAVLFGIGLEVVYKLGVGNVIAAVAGFLTLRIAHGLASDGDTFAVLEAVLDTQFWLATHVVCVTLGYAATYVSGLLGLVYLVRGALTTGLTPEQDRSLTRMNYGVLCFAIFFSFVGTVLGGLWADDSWGRFWGWDPKENGALIIVLWNALVLHARWDGLVKSRGLAVLTVLGNIVVSWSWFGVNELGVGLHSYGFTEGRLMKLTLFCASQLLIAGLGCLPRRWWRSTGGNEPTSTSPA